MDSTVLENGIVPRGSLADADCPVCFNLYDGIIRRPKILTCQHVFCAICLKIMVKRDDDCWVVQCPFCRYLTVVPNGSIRSLPDQETLIEHLRKKLPGDNRELLLSPQLLTPEQRVSPRPAAFVRIDGETSEDNWNEVAARRLMVLLLLVLSLVLLFWLLYNTSLFWT